MKIKKRTLEYYEWDDIEKFLCKELGIPEDGFRDFHLYYGKFRGCSRDEYWSKTRSDSSYMDFWNFWTDEVVGEIYNGMYHCIFLEDHFFKRLKEDCLDWQKQIIGPLKKLKEKLGEEIVIYYWW